MLFIKIMHKENAKAKSLSDLSAKNLEKNKLNL